MVSPSHGPTPVRHRTKNEFVHDLLRGEILSLALKPGTDLNIDEIARRLGVSAIPVREAVARLASERFVVMRPHVGAQVVPIDENSVHDIFALLEGLESAAAPRIASLATETDVNDLGRLLDEMDRPALRSELIKWGAANTGFHLRMAAISALPLVQDQLRVAFDHWERIRLHLFQAASPQRVTLAQEEHREIVDALKRRAGARLATLLRTHNQAARDAYLRLLK